MVEGFGTGLDRRLFNFRILRLVPKRETFKKRSWSCVRVRWGVSGSPEDGLGTDALDERSGRTNPWVSGRDGSNRYFEPIKKEFGSRGLYPLHLQVGRASGFGYLYHGRSESGIEVLETIESSQGSGRDYPASQFLIS